MQDKNQMLRQVLGVPAMLEDIFTGLEAEALSSMPDEEVVNINFIYLFGCGDSYSAAVGAADAFASLAGIPAQAITSMQASKFIAGVCVPSPVKSTLAIGVSNSGEAARSVEAMKALAKFGSSTLAVTSNPSSSMGSAARRVLNARSSVPDLGPGIHSYAAAQMALYLLAVRYGVQRGLISAAKADKMKRELSGYGDILKRTFELNAEKLNSFSDLCSKFGCVEFLAAGPARGAADFGAAKVIEAVGLPSMGQDLEEFAHINFFTNHPETIPTVLMCSADSKALVRSRELELALRHLGRPYVVITDSGDFLAEDERLIRIPSTVNEIFAPLLFSCLTAYLASGMASGADNEYFRGHKGPYSEEGYPTIRQSQIVF